MMRFMVCTLTVILKDLLYTKYVEHVRGQITKLFPLTNLNKYLYNGKSEIKGS